MATVSPARDEGAGYVAWGHSTVVDPWGEVVGKAGSSEETIYVDINLVNNSTVKIRKPDTHYRQHQKLNY